jgi:hypothetical protein
MATPTKTQNGTLLAWTSIASGVCSVGSAVDVSTKFAATVFVRLGRATGTAFTAGSPNIRIEASYKSSGDNSWIPLAVFQPAVGASIASTTVSGAISASNPTVVLASVTNIAAGDILFLGDASSANYELIRVKSIASTTITPEETIVNAHSNAAVVTDQAEMYVAPLDLLAIGRIRAVVDNIGSGQGIKVEIGIVYADSVG